MRGEAGTGEAQTATHAPHSADARRTRRIPKPVLTIFTIISGGVSPGGIGIRNDGITNIITAVGTGVATIAGILDRRHRMLSPRPMAR